MKKVIAIVAAMGMLGAVPAFAQAKNFEGLSVGANLEVDRGSLSASDGSSDSAHSTRLGLQARYDWVLNDQFLLGLGVSAGPGHRQAGTYLGGSDAYTKNRYSIDLMPGYAISNTLMVYGKVSALTAKALSNDGTSTASVHGTGYGIGLRGLIDNNTFWQAGLDTQRFHDVTFGGTGTTATFKDNILSVGVGYKF